MVPLHFITYLTLFYNSILYLIIKVLKVLSIIPTHEMAQAAYIRAAGFTFSFKP